MNEKEKLISILDNLNESFKLSLYNFVDETAIIKDIFNGNMFYCDVLFNEKKAFFINFVKKETSSLNIQDLK